MALTKIKTSNLETSIDLTGINDTATSQILTVSDTGIDVTGTVTADGLTVDVTTGQIRSNVNGFLYLKQNLDVATAGGRLYFESNAGTLGNIRAEQDGVGSTAADIAMWTSNGTSELRRVEVKSNGDISFYEDTGTTAKFFWDASAESLGIGTSSPNAKLEVQDANGVSLKFGDLASYPNSVVPCFIGTATSALAGVNGDLVLCPRTSDAGKILFATGHGQAEERMRIDSSGNVGIGTSSPAVALQIEQGGEPTVRLNSSGLGVTADFKIESSGGILRTNTNHPLIFRTNNTERMRILQGGGLTFNGNTASENALDDYEEGTFEPTFTSAAGDFTNIGYNGDTGGRYIKIGNLVYAQGCARINGILDKSNRSNGETLVLGNLPFTNSSRSNGDNADSIANVRCPVWGSGDVPDRGTMRLSHPGFSLVQQRSNATSHTITVGDLPSDAMMQFTVMYTTN